MSRAFRRLPLWLLWPSCAMVCLTVASGVHAGDAGPVQRVLLVHSFGSSAPPFTTHSTAFQATLTQELGKRVDLDEISLDMARHQPGMEEPFVELLLKRLARWHPDLVVPIGSPAGRFVEKFRHRLFPQTPVIYTGMDRRTLRPDTFENNATFVGEDFDLASLVEDILQLAPDTNNIVVILGDTPLERYWTKAFRSAFEPFANRVKFTWVNDLSFDQMLELAAKLPPRSFILLGLLLRDASGVTHNEDEALQRLHAVANAPINGLYRNQLGLGIVGGRLYQGELQGIESARIAIRILRGEPISNFPPKIIGTLGPRYDWRELQRWNISERRLPSGSVIEFRQPTVWDRYKWYIVGALIIIVIQGAMIIDLLLQRRRRRRMQAELRDSQQLMDLATTAGGIGLWARDLKTDTIWANASLRSMFDLGENGTIRLSDMLARVHPDDNSRVTREMQQTQQEDLPFEGEFRVPLADGKVRWVLAKGRTVQISQGPSEPRMGVVLDITQRKRTELEVQRNREELAHVTRVATVAELTTSIAHELNQPLGAILSNAEAAEMFLMAEPPALDEVREILADIRKDDQRASEVIRRMRGLLRKQELAPKSIDVNDAVEEALKLLSIDAAHRKVALKFERTADLPRAWCDPVHWQQVVLNLVLNGMEAMAGLPEEQRQVVIRTGPGDNGTVKIAVADSGPGIPVDRLPKVFEPFFTTKKDGMGMGLSIARTIVEAHLGKIWAENNSEAGATFYFTMPVAKEASA
ncbi:MAG: sensor histidine kinase [Candidatus Binatia bacterium]